MLEEAGVTFEEAAPAPVGPAPAIVDGALEITEWPAILLHLADRRPDRGLSPPLGSDDRARYYRWIAYVAGVVDPALARISVRDVLAPEPARVPVIDAAARRDLDVIARTLAAAAGDRPFLAGDTFTAADVAAGSAAAWLDRFGLLDEQPRLAAYARRLADRPACVRTHAALLADLTTAKRWPTAHRLRPGEGWPVFFTGRPNQHEGSYRDLVEHLDTRRPLWLLQLQYAEEDQLGRPYTREEMIAWARRYHAAMRAIQPEGPLHVAGMCEGGLLAYEVCRIEEAAGRTLAFLGLFDTWPEENTRDPVLFYVDEAQRALQRAAARAARRALSGARRALDHLDPASRDRRPPAPAPAVPAAPIAPDRQPAPAVNPWKDRIALGKTFVPVPVRSPITVFRSNQQFYWRIRDPLLGWGSRTTGGVEVHDITGHHLRVLRNPNAALTADKLGRCLRRLDEQQARTASSSSPAPGATSAPR